MGNELKIVLIVIAVYLVIGIQNLVNTSVFLIPYELNPLVILSVSGINLFGYLKQKEKQALSIRLIYFVGILFYSFLSTRTLNILNNRLDNDIFLDLSNNDFTALIAILAFYISMIAISLKMRSKSIVYYASLSLLIFSFIGALINIELLQIICFTLYVISVIVHSRIQSNNDAYIQFLPVVYQLFLFVVLENTYFALIKYC